MIDIDGNAAKNSNQKTRNMLALRNNEYRDSRLREINGEGGAGRNFLRASKHDKLRPS